MVIENRRPLSALLSQAFVAFIIEFDNEFEHQVPHRTTNHGSSPGIARAPWLVSMAMWVRYLQYVPAEGIRFSELQQRIGISNKGLQTWLTRLGKWWGYLSVSASSSGRIAADALIRPTPGGMRAIEAWRPLTGVIEKRWQDRFGSTVCEHLKLALGGVVSQLDANIPNFFSVLEYPSAKNRAPEPSTPAEELPLPQLMAKTLIAWDREFEHRSQAPLAVCANLLRLMPDGSVRLRDLPRLACLAKEGVEAAIRMSTRRGCTVMQVDAGSRTKLLRATPKGIRARDAYQRISLQIEEAWQEQFGREKLQMLYGSLQKIVGQDGATSPLLPGLKPYQTGWRASMPPMECLPHFPMILHRGGFPDGS